MSFFGTNANYRRFSFFFFFFLSFISSKDVARRQSLRLRQAATNLSPKVEKKYRLCARKRMEKGELRSIETSGKRSYVPCAIHHGPSSVVSAAEHVAQKMGYAGTRNVCVRLRIVVAFAMASRLHCDLKNPRSTLAKLLHHISFTRTKTNLLNLMAFNGCFVVIALRFALSILKPLVDLTC